MSANTPDFSFLGAPAKTTFESNRPESESALWRCGHVLIAKKYVSKFPDRCIKKNQRALGHVKVWAGCNGITPSSTLKWFLFFWFLRHGFGFGGEDVFEEYRRKYIELDLGVGKGILSQRRWRKILGLLTLLLIIPTIGLSIWLGHLTENARGSQELLFLILMFFIPLIPLAVGLWLCVEKPPVQVEKLDEQYALLRGVHKDYLAEFPEWDVQLPARG